MSTVTIVLLVILVILIAALIGLYFFGKKAQKKQEEQQAQIEATKQTVSMLVIDKKRMPLKESGLPQMVIEQTPKLMRRSKLPIVKAKIGPKIAIMIADEKVFDLIPLKKEIKAEVSGLYIVGVKGIRGSLQTPAPKKKGFFAKLAATLFGEEEESTDVEHVEVPESQDLENISDENLQILKELEAAEQAGAAKEDKKQAKKDKKKAKKEKKEKEPKEKKPRKKREKKVKEPKPEEPDNTPPLPKKPVILIFLMAFSILALVLLMMKLSGKNSYIDTAKQAMDNGEYVEAYEQLSGLNLKGNDQKLYKEVSTMAAVQEQYQAYLTLMGADKYDLALDALVRGIGRYDKGLDNAKKYGREGEMNHLKDQLEEALDQQFGMSTDDARKLYKIKDREEYSKEIQKIIQKMNLGQKEK